MARRGFTVVEMVLVACLTAIMIGTLTLLYGFTFRSISESATTLSTTDQARRVLDTVAAAAEQSITCQTVTQNGQTALKCLMPAVGTDTNGDGYCETYQPSAISPRGVERYGAGDRVWFYLSDATGIFGVAGTTLWRAQRTDDDLPTAADADAAWTFYGGNGPPCHGLISAAGFEVDAAAHTTEIAITASSLLSSERQPGVGSPPDASMSVTLKRNVEWRNWRP